MIILAQDVDVQEERFDHHAKQSLLYDSLLETRPGYIRSQSDRNGWGRHSTYREGILSPSPTELASSFGGEVTWDPEPLILFNPGGEVRLAEEKRLRLPKTEGV